MGLWTLGRTCFISGIAHSITGISCNKFGVRGAIQNARFPVANCIFRTSVKTNIIETIRIFFLTYRIWASEVLKITRTVFDEAVFLRGSIQWACVITLFPVYELGVGTYFFAVIMPLIIALHLYSYFSRKAFNILSLKYCVDIR